VTVFHPTAEFQVSSVAGGIRNGCNILDVVDGTLCAAWKGMGEPADVRVSTWRGGNNGFGFAQTVHNSWTRCAPTLASWGDTLVLTWRGDDREKTMWWINGELRVPTDTAERLV